MRAIIKLHRMLGDRVVRNNWVEIFFQGEKIFQKIKSEYENVEVKFTIAKQEADTDIRNYCLRNIKNNVPTIIMSGDASLLLGLPISDSVSIIRPTELQPKMNTLHDKVFLYGPTYNLKSVCTRLTTICESILASCESTHSVRALLNDSSSLTDVTLVMVASLLGGEHDRVDYSSQSNPHTVIHYFSDTFLDDKHPFRQSDCRSQRYIAMATVAVYFYMEYVQRVHGAETTQLTFNNCFEWFDGFLSSLVSSDSAASDGVVVGKGEAPSALSELTPSLLRTVLTNRATETTSDIKAIPDSSDEDALEMPSELDIEALNELIAANKALMDSDPMSCPGQNMQESEPAPVVVVPQQLYRGEWGFWLSHEDAELALTCEEVLQPVLSLYTQIKHTMRLQRLRIRKTFPREHAVYKLIRSVNSPGAVEAYNQWLLLVRGRLYGKAGAAKAASCDMLMWRSFIVMRSGDENEKEMQSTIQVSTTTEAVTSFTYGTLYSEVRRSGVLPSRGTMNPTQVTRRVVANSLVVDVVVELEDLDREEGEVAEEESALMPPISSGGDKSRAYTVHWEPTSQDQSLFCDPTYPRYASRVHFQTAIADSPLHNMQARAALMQELLQMEGEGASPIEAVERLVLPASYSALRTIVSDLWIDSCLGLVQSGFMTSQMAAEGASTLSMLLQHVYCTFGEEYRHMSDWGTVKLNELRVLVEALLMAPLFAAHAAGAVTVVNDESCTTSFQDSVAAMHTSFRDCLETNGVSTQFLPIALRWTELISKLFNKLSDVLGRDCEEAGRWFDSCGLLFTFQVVYSPQCVDEHFLSTVLQAMIGVQQTQCDLVTRASGEVHEVMMRELFTCTYCI